MWGFLILVVSLVAAVVCTLFLFTGENLLLVWMLIEMSTLCVFPLFFFDRRCGYGALMLFFIVSSISSLMVLCGVLTESLWVVSFMGFMIKFGVFPFVHWVYQVTLNSNWLVVWSLSTFLKVPVLLIPVLFGLRVSFWVSAFVVLTLVVLAILFWVFSYNWFCCWSHMMLASTAVLVSVSMNSSVDVALSLLAIYVFWSTLVVLFLTWYCNGSGSYLSLGWWYLFGVLLIASPLSIVLVYKLISACSISACPFLIVVAWVIYSVSEQLWLFSWSVNSSFPRDASGFSDSL